MPVMVAVCEDERNLREEISNLIQGNIGVAPDCYVSGEALIASGNEYELYILDIQMQGISGMELAERIRGKREHPGPIIIFVTAFREHMQKAFDVKAYHFLLKPLDKEKFASVLTGAIAEISGRRKREHIAVRAGGATHTVAQDNILYIESSGKKVTVHTGNGVLECTGMIGEFAGMLESNPVFFRCHRCYIVNMEHIARYSAKALTMSNGQEIFLARDKYKPFVSAFARYAMK